MIAYIFLLLALRSTILAWQEKKSRVLKIFDTILGIFSFAIFLAVPKDLQWKPLLIIAIVIGFSLYRRLSQTYKFSYQNVISFLGLYLFGAGVAIASLFFRMTEEKTIGKLIVTGKVEPQWVSWKNPGNSQMEAAWLDAYEVVIQDQKGREIARQSVYGDLVGLRAEIITIDWPLRLLGFSNLYRLEMIHNGYSTAARHNFLPHQGFQLPFQFKGLQYLWKKIYSGEWKIPGIKSSSLESTFFPLKTSENLLSVSDP
jgi:hypothetical protein